MKENFFLYARKSTDTEEKQILSIEAQLAELKIFSVREGLQIKEVLIEHMTAKEPGRPIFNSMMKRIEKGEASGIIAWHPDRLARNTVDGGLIVHFLDRKLLQYLKFPTFWFENTPQGKFMLNISFGQSKYFVDNLSENVERGMRHKIRRGEWTGKAPPGYFNDPVSRKVLLDPIKADLVKRLFEIYATGDHRVYHLRKLTFEWGLTNKKGLPLSNATIHALLTNPFYIGLMRYKGELFPGTHVPLISKKLFDQVQETHQRKGKPLKNRKHGFPFLGLIQCSSCGGMITAERQKGHHYYRCTKKMGIKCPERYIREEALAEQIKQGLLSASLPPEAYDYMINKLNEEAKEAGQSIAPELTLGDQKIKELKSKLDCLLDLHLDGGVDKQEYQAKKEALLLSQATLKEHKAIMEDGAMAWLEPCREFLNSALDAGQVAESGDFEKLRNFAKKTGSNHRMAARRLSFEFNFPWALFGGSAFDSSNSAGEFRIQGPKESHLAGSLKPLPAAFAAGNFLKTRYNYELCRLPESNRDEVAPTGF